MNENINLCELLKGHEGETFYSPLFGNVILEKIKKEYSTPIRVIIIDNNEIATFTKEGKYHISHYNAECMLFPSKDQRDWNKWIKEQKPKVPKTWSELIKARKVKTLGATTIESPYCSIAIAASDERNETVRGTSIERAALALLKIHQLIEVGYGGNVTKEEWKDSNTVKYFVSMIGDSIVLANTNNCYYEPIAFHTHEQANEFRTYKENIQLIKELYGLACSE